MKQYDTGIATRKLILETSKELFYEKGFRETSYHEICQKSHLFRSSAYYHFKDKDTIRYEVLWEWMTSFRRLAEQYCSKEEYAYTLAMYILWERCHSDPKMGKFMKDYWNDCPIYSPNIPLSQFFRISYQKMYGHIWDFEKISTLSFASVYGYVIGMYHLMVDQPEVYSAKEIVHHSITWGMTIWNIPQDKIDHLWTELEAYIDTVPAEEIRRIPLYQKA